MPCPSAISSDKSISMKSTFGYLVPIITSNPRQPIADAMQHINCKKDIPYFQIKPITKEYIPQ